MGAKVINPTSSAIQLPAPLSFFPSDKSKFFCGGCFDGNIVWCDFQNPGNNLTHCRGKRHDFGFLQTNYGIQINDPESFFLMSMNVFSSRILLSISFRVLSVSGK